MKRITMSGTLLLTLTALVAGCDTGPSPVDPSMAATFAVLDGTAQASAEQLAALRRATARFERIDAAMAAGYETQITPCWAHHSAGAMGYHFGKVDLLDANVDLMEPELLIYEPEASGRMKLVGMEYVVPRDAWEQANHDLNDPDDVPVLLGQRYTPHSFLPIFKLHIWLWQKNPSGVFADWNPTVTCAYADSTEVF